MPCQVIVGRFLTRNLDILILQIRWVKMNFYVISRDSRVADYGPESVILQIDRWNDYSFVTMFHMSACDQSGSKYDIGNVKIGFVGQTTETSTHQRLDKHFEKLGADFFSLGEDVEFYKKIRELPHEMGRRILLSLRDIVVSPEIIEIVKDEKVFGTSLLRGISLSTVKGQFSRVLDGYPELTNFDFEFQREKSIKMGEINLRFSVRVGALPNTNIHAVIGRNGVGKTTLLNDMIDAIIGEPENVRFVDREMFSDREISRDYFSSLVSVSFSAFDPFNPPTEQPDPAKGTCYFYIGLKDSKDDDRLRSISELQSDLTKSLIVCFANSNKTKRWFHAIEKLGSDENFTSMELEILEEKYRELRSKLRPEEQSDSVEFRDKYFDVIRPFLKRMSSGHAVVLLSITRLVATVEEKTLVLLDEPESHLHPPLLSAFVRALADLLIEQNGVAIIATHSPVVLQEIPRSCVWKMHRVGLSVEASRPSVETFGENVGLLTSEVFSLEVERSGFHQLLADSVRSGGDYNSIMESYDGQLGFEGRAILKSLIAVREKERQL
ncbi:AAA family ATPase [Burkholderia gladioli]|nr:AAA family ATPase [Burkholderia gladioli]